MRMIAAALGASMFMAFPQSAWSWGDTGHKVVALIATHYLPPPLMARINAMLAADPDNLTAHDFASAATWADRYRDENNRHDHYEETKRWHFVDLEISGPNITQACWGRHPLPAGTLASNGDKMDCVVDKINQFATELSSPRMDAEERVMALKFLLHFVGDVHQPLHSSDNHDEGGNEVNVIAAEFREGKLHGYWDTQFVEALGSSPKDIADKLFNAITPSEKETWEEGKPDDWAKEAFALSKQDAYGNPPLSKTRLEHLSPGYVTKAETDASLQLSRAGVRLARMLRDAVGTP
jgi:hypothetical protein